MHGMIQLPNNIIPASFPLGRVWFAVAVLSHKDALAGIKELDFPTFSPSERRYRVIRGKKVKVEAPLFSGYLFVSFDREADEWGRINDVDGVLGILKNGQFPVRVPDAAIDRLRVAESIGAFDKTKPPTIGLAVEATDGPLAGWVGKIVRARSSERVDVLMQLLGQSVVVNYSLSSLREVD